MTSLTDIERMLPWGFHDGHLEAVSVDYLARTLTLVLRLPVSKHQDMERRARVVVTGLELFAIAPPGDDDGDYPRMPAGGLVLDAGEGPAEGADARLPVLPPDVFVHHLLVQNWNYQPIQIAGRDATLEWLGEPTTRTDGGGAYFPGDNPDLT